MPGVRPLLVSSVAVFATALVGGHRDGVIAFATDRTVGAEGLVSVSPIGGAPTRLFAGEAAEPPVVSPDGRRVALVAGDTIDVVAADGKSTEPIGAGRSPTWSPDSRSIAFIDAKTGEIEIASADGQQPLRDLGVFGTEPIWSPRGDWISFFSDDNTLELVHPDGTGRTVLATDAYADARILPVEWSYDGAWLSFGSVPADTDVLELNVARPDGTGRRSFGSTAPPAWSPRADLLAFESNDNGFEIAAPDGGVRSTSDSIPGTPVWSPNGKAIAVGSSDFPGISIVDAHAGTTRRISIGGVPTWSPGSTRIAAVRGSILRVSSTSGGRPHVLAQGADSSAVWLRNGRIAYVTQARVRSEVETTKGRALLRGPTRFQAGEGVEFAGLAWAPNGSALACLYGSELRIVTSDGRSSRVLARGVTDGPAWSPDGRVIAFAAAGGLRLVDAAGGPSRLLTRAGETMPAWSPDGRRIAFLHVDENADVSDLYVVDRDGRHVTRLAKDVSSAPSWSPDGERIAFSVGGDYIPTAIETIRVDGTGLSEPASAPAAEDYGDVLSNPQWSPDGRTILYYDDEYFCGSKCDELHLTLMRPDGTDKRRLVDDVLGAAWAPDGNELLGQYAPDESLLTVDVRTGQRRFLAGRAGAWAWQPLPARR